MRKLGVKSTVEMVRVVLAASAAWHLPGAVLDLCQCVRAACRYPCISCGIGRQAPTWRAGRGTALCEQWMNGGYGKKSRQPPTTAILNSRWLKPIACIPSSSPAAVPPAAGSRRRPASGSVSARRIGVHGGTKAEYDRYFSLRARLQVML